MKTTNVVITDKDIEESFRLTVDNIREGLFVIFTKDEQARNICGPVLLSDKIIIGHPAFIKNKYCHITSVGLMQGPFSINSYELDKSDLWWIIPRLSTFPNSKPKTRFSILR